MCGIVGFMDLARNKGPDQMESELRKMSQSLIHRGPDDEGHWLDPEFGVALGHRRLSVVDLSSTGHQPMRSVSGRYHIVFNGEVYNFKDLSSELEAKGFQFLGHSDTEVMLAAFEAWGIHDAVVRFSGMFAFAVWDAYDKTLTLARDRIGEKPLYYGWSKGTFLFGSELKALVAHSDWTGNLDRNALASYMRYNHVPGPLSIYEDIGKLPPGTFITLPADARARKASPLQYWSLHEVVKRGKSSPFQGSERDAQEHLDQMLRKIIRRQMIADVPLGAFLSGGIDSSLVVALAQTQSTQPVRTFTIGFHEKEFNEAGFAMDVSRHLGTEHTELYVSAEQALEVIPKLPYIHDEPFADTSQIPVYLLSEMTRRHVTVSLSGDGGDELFGGYSRYQLADTLKWIDTHFPLPVRKSLGRMLAILPPSKWDLLFRNFSTLLPSRLKVSHAGNKIVKLSELLCMESGKDFYSDMMSYWKRPEELVLGSHEPRTLMRSGAQWPDFSEFSDLMMYLDTQSYLPDDIMAKVDRASMAVSLETRAPLLDHELVEFAWTLPLSMKIKDGQGKWLLRKVLYDYVPPSLIERPKVGFAVPVAAWLRGSLREWAESLLEESRLRQEGYLNPTLVRKRWKEHLSGSRDWTFHIWNVLMFQAWREKT